MKVWDANKSAIIFRTKQKWGELHNMCMGFPIQYKNETYLTSEHLYQCCKFKNNPDIIDKIRKAHNGYVSKVISRENDHLRDSNFNKVEVMRCVLYLKLTQHSERLLPILNEVVNSKLHVVEHSNKDSFWGAQLNDNKDKLIGENVLGILWHEVFNYYINRVV